jgi:hypothetical protein
MCPARRSSLNMERETVGVLNFDRNCRASMCQRFAHWRCGKYVNDINHITSCSGVDASAFRLHARCGMRARTRQQKQPQLARAITVLASAGAPARRRWHCIPLHSHIAARDAGCAIDPAEPPRLRWSDALAWAGCLHVPAAGGLFGRDARTWAELPAQRAMRIGPGLRRRQMHDRPALRGGDQYGARPWRHERWRGPRSSWQRRCWGW